MKHNPREWDQALKPNAKLPSVRPRKRCIGRLVRVRNGKLVTQRKVWAENDAPFMVHAVRQFRKPIASILADTKALERWQQRKWNEPSELKVHYI